MAIALDANLGTNTDSAGATSLAKNITSAAASGAKIFVFGYTDNVCTHSMSGGGLTWTKDVQYNAGDGAQFSIFSADAPSGLASGTTLTISCTGTPNILSLMIVSFTGLAAQGSVVDAFSSGREQFNVTSWTSNNVTTANADDLLLVYAHTGGVDSPTNTPGAGYTGIHNLAASGNTSLASQYRIVSATGTYNATGTWSTSQSGAEGHSIIGTYKAATGGGTSVTAPAGTLTLGAVAPAVQGAAQVTAPAGGLTLGATAPVITAGTTVTHTVGVTTLGAVAPVISAGAAITAPAGAITLGGVAPSLTATATVTQTAGLLTLQGGSHTLSGATSGFTYKIKPPSGVPAILYLLE